MATSTSKKKTGFRAILPALAFIAMGILFLVKKGEMLKWILLIAGVFFIVQGLVDLLKYKQMTTGIVEILLGAAAIILGIWHIELAAIILGVIVIVFSLLSLFSGPRDLWSTLVNILTLVAGVLLLVNQWCVANWFFILLGIVLIVNGILLLLKRG